MKIEFYFSPYEMRAINTVKEVFGITGINYENVPVDKMESFGDVDGGKSLSYYINADAVNSVLYTLAKYNREIKAVIGAVKAYVENFTCLLTSGLIEELNNAVTRKSRINIRKNYKY